VLSKDLFFFGSKLGDSLLVQYHKTVDDVRSAMLVDAQPPAKKPRLDQEIELYGTEDLTHFSGVGGGSGAPVGATRFTFFVRDSLVNVGPIGDFAIGNPPDLSEEFSSENSHQLDVVACSGYGKTGALSVLQRTVKPHIVASWDNIGSSYDLWSIYVRQPGSPPDETKYDKILVISGKSNTHILELGEDYQGLANSHFHTSGPTIYAGSIMNQERVIQVYSTGIRLLDAGFLLVQEVPVSKESHITACSAEGDFVLIQHSNDTVSLLKMDSAQGNLSFESLSPNVNASPITASCLYADRSGLFVGLEEAALSAPRSRAPADEKGSSRFSEDIIDMQLYGDAPSNPEPAPAKKPDMENGTTGKHAETPAEVKYFCILCRQNGYFEILTLPDFEVVFSCPNFPLALPLLKDTLVVGEGTSHESPEVREITLVGLGTGVYREPHLVARYDDGSMALYKAFQCLVSPTATTAAEGSQSQSQSQNLLPSRAPSQSSLLPAAVQSRLAIRFSKVSGTPLKPFEKTAEAGKKKEQATGDDSSAALAPKAAGEEPAEQQQQQRLQKTLSEGKNPQKSKAKAQEAAVSFRRRKFRAFDNIWGFSGIFMSGDRPGWLMHSNKGLFYHPMGIDGSVYCFTPFHNVNCPRGFVYFNGQGFLRLCSLPPHMNFNFPWAVRKIPFRRTLHNIAYHADSSTYVLSTSVPVPYKKPPEPREEGDDIRPAEPPVVSQRKEGRVYPEPESLSFKLELVSTRAWASIDQYEFRDYEHILCLRTLSLTTSQTATGRKKFICLGTGFQKGEEMQSRGRLFLFDVIEVVPEEGQSEPNLKLKFLAEKEYKAPITSIAESNGYIVACVGQKIIVHAFDKSETLAGVAFIDQQVYATSVSAIKNVILLGDALRSVWFLRSTVGLSRPFFFFLKKNNFRTNFSISFSVSFFFFFLSRIILSVWR